MYILPKASLMSCVLSLLGLLFLLPRLKSITIAGRRKKSRKMKRLRDPAFKGNYTQKSKSSLSLRWNFASPCDMLANPVQGNQPAHDVFCSCIHSGAYLTHRCFDLRFLAVQQSGNISVLIIHRCFSKQASCPSTF